MLHTYVIRHTVSVILIHTVTDETRIDARCERRSWLIVMGPARAVPVAARKVTGHSLFVEQRYFPFYHRVHNSRGRPLAL